MSYAIPRPFISHLGDACIPLDDKTLYGKLITHIARQWPDHEVIGFPYSTSVLLWNAAHEDARAATLRQIRASLFGIAAEDGLAIVGLGPVLLLPPDHQISSSPGQLSRLTKVTPDSMLPTKQEIRVLYQQAHVIAPLTSETDIPNRRLTSRGNVG